jgi:hypothetical protein
VREQLEERLVALRKEYEAGRQMLADLEARQLELQQTLLRIGGAVQVLEELLGDGDPAAPPTATEGRVPANASAGPA